MEVRYRVFTRHYVTDGKSLTHFHIIEEVWSNGEQWRQNATVLDEEGFNKLHAAMTAAAKQSVKAKP